MAACFQRIQVSQDIHLRSAILQETNGRAFFGGIVQLEPRDLSWHVSALVFNPWSFSWSMGRPGVLVLALDV